MSDDPTEPETFGDDEVPELDEEVPEADAAEQYTRVTTPRTPMIHCRSPGWTRWRR